MTLISIACATIYSNIADFKAFKKEIETRDTFRKVQNLQSEVNAINMKLEKQGEINNVLLLQMKKISDREREDFGNLMYMKGKFNLH